MLRSLRLLALALTVSLAFSTAARAQNGTFDDISVPSDPAITGNNAGASGGELTDAAAGYQTSGGTQVNPPSTPVFSSFIGETYDVSSFTSGGIQFPNGSGESYGDWYGWSVSSANNVVFPTLTDYNNAGQADYSTPYQYSAYANLQSTSGGELTGGGAGGSANYGVFFDDGVATDERLTLPAGSSPVSIQITNATYTALSVLYGDAFSPAFNASLAQQLGANPYLDLTITGLTSGGTQVGTPITVDLAQYSGGSLQLINQWTNVALSGLAGAEQLQFSLSTNVASGAGPTVPLYFAADNLLVTPEPSSLVLVLIGGLSALVVMLRRRWAR